MRYAAGAAWMSRATSSPTSSTRARPRASRRRPGGRRKNCGLPKAPRAAPHPAGRHRVGVGARGVVRVEAFPADLEGHQRSVRQAFPSGLPRRDPRADRCAVRRLARGQPRLPAEVLAHREQVVAERHVLRMPRVGDVAVVADRRAASPFGRHSGTALPGGGITAAIDGTIAAKAGSRGRPSARGLRRPSRAGRRDVRARARRRARAPPPAGRITCAWASGRPGGGRRSARSRARAAREQRCRIRSRRRARRTRSTPSRLAPGAWRATRLRPRRRGSPGGEGTRSCRDSVILERCEATGSRTSVSSSSTLRRPRRRSRGRGSRRGATRAGAQGLGRAREASA